MKGLLSLTQVFSRLSTLPEERVAAYQVILEASLASITRAQAGLVAIQRDGEWVVLASRGGPGTGLNLGDAIDRCLLDGHFRATTEFICGRIFTDQGASLALRLECGSQPFTADEKVLFKVTLDLISAYESYNGSQRASRHAQETVKQLLDLVSGLRDTDPQGSSFFLELLHSALGVVEEADYGSVALFDGNCWVFVAAVGHDLDGLRHLCIAPDEFGSFNEATVVEDVLHRGDLPSSQALRDILAHSRPISRSLIVGLEVVPDFRVNLSLDIRAGSSKRFSDNSKLAIDRFGKIASSFLRLSVQRDIVERSYRSFTDKLAILAEAHDHHTAQHNGRVSRLSAFLAQKLGLEPSLVDGIRKGAMVHDIGKIFLPPELLNKKERLSPEEWEKVKEHTLLAERLLSDPYFDLDRKIAVSHHERFDGTGYPRGLKGDEIPIEAQIVSVADVYDALRDARPYKPALSPQDALARMRHGDQRLAPGAFNPELLELLEEHWQAIDDLWSQPTPGQARVSSTASLQSRAGNSTGE